MDEIEEQAYQELFNFMADAYGLILTNEELIAIAEEGAKLKAVLDKKKQD